MDIKNYKIRLLIYLAAGSIGLFLAAPVFFDYVSNIGLNNTIQGYSIPLAYFCLAGFMLFFVPAFVIGEILRIAFIDDMEISLHKLENRLTLYALIGLISLFWQLVERYNFQLDYVMWFSSTFRTGQPLVLFILPVILAFWIGETIRLIAKIHTQRKRLTSKPPIELSGLVLMATVWPILGLIVSHSALQTMTHPALMPQVANITNVLGIHAVLMYGIAILCVGCLQVLTSYGLARGRAFGYKFGLGIPLMLLMINGIYGVLSLFATIARGWYFDSGLYGWFFGWFFGIGIGWVIVNWHYLRKPSVKAFLGVSMQV